MRKPRDDTVNRKAVRRNVGDDNMMEKRHQLSRLQQYVREACIITSTRSTLLSPTSRIASPQHFNSMQQLVVCVCVCVLFSDFFWRDDDDE